MLAFLGTFRCVSCKRFLLLKQLSLVSFISVRTAVKHIRNEQGKSKERKNEERIRKWQRKNKERAIGLPYRFVV